jgi:ATP-dependent protease ClpP protease subunit
MNEVLLYGLIWSQPAIDFINAINAIEGDEMTVRINSQGGDVNHGYGMIAKYREFEGTKKVKVDGQAASMAAFYLLYADEVEALDVSRIMFHRAGYSSWYEEQMPEAVKADLMEMNAMLEKAFRNKINVKKFEEIKGMKVKDLFAMDDRKEVFLSAKEAKEIGLIDKIVKITPDKKTAINAEMQRIAATYGMDSGIQEMKSAAATQELPNKHPNKKANMTIEQLQAEHPALFAQAVQIGVQQGIESERDRVGAWAAFSEADPQAVKDGIASGKSMSQTQMAELTIKMTAKASKDALEAEGRQTPGVTAQASATPENKEGEGVEETPVAKFENDIMAHLGLDKK